MINIIFNTGLILTRLYIFFMGAGLMLQRDPDYVTGIFSILIAGIMGLLMLPWPRIPDNKETSEREK